MSHFPYQFLKSMYSVRLYFHIKIQKKFNEEVVSNRELEEICKDPVFLEAIYLASPDFYERTIEWLSGKNISIKQYEKLKNTLLKYYTRMGMRCTPFGLFSMVGIGMFGNNKRESLSLELNRIKELQKEISLNYVRDTKLDMHFLIALSRHF